MTTSARDAFGDALFDSQLPDYVRARSGQYWTPVAVAAHVAAVFRKRGSRRVLDVGCGPGKFCVVAGCLQPSIRFHGIDQRARLIEVGEGLARRCGANNVELSVGDVTQVPWDAYDGLYFFNPFAENTLERPERFDDDPEFSTM